MAFRFVKDRRLFIFNSFFALRGGEGAYVDGVTRSQDIPDLGTPSTLRRLLI